MRSSRVPLAAVTVIVVLHVLMLAGGERLSLGTQGGHAARDGAGTMRMAEEAPAAWAGPPDAPSDGGHDMAITCLAVLIVVTVTLPRLCRGVVRRLVPARPAPPRPPAVRPPIPWTPAPATP
jgi:hypothetical protein